MLKTQLASCLISSQGLCLVKLNGWRIWCNKTPQLAGNGEPLFSKVSLGTADGVQACLEDCACEARRRISA